MNEEKKCQEMTLLEFALTMRRKYGKGIVLYGKEVLGYMLPKHPDFNEIDKAAVDFVDENSFVVMFPTVENLQEELAQGKEVIWLNTFARKGDLIAKTKVLWPPRWEDLSDKFLYT